MATSNVAASPGPYPNTQTYTVSFTGSAATSTSNIVSTTSGLMTYSVMTGSSGTATINLWGSNDGVLFVKLPAGTATTGSDISATSTAQVTFYVDKPVRFLQLQCTGYTGGTAVVYLLH